MSRPLLRWAVPLSAAAAILGVGLAASALRAAADPNLPPRSAAQLLVDLQTARLDGLSGTVVQSADLGLPALPGRAGGSGSAQFNSLVTGSHTLRVWYSGPDKVRVALLGKLGESDVIRNGRDLWIWSSDGQTAQHRTLPEGAVGMGHTGEHPGLLPATPQQAADQVLAALDPSTVVSTAGTARVAGRAAYELVLAPRDAASLVSQVRLAVDGEQRVPLRVQVYAKGATAPAFEVGFRQVDFTRPGDEHFRFTPPPGTNVEENDSMQRPHRPKAPDAAAPTTPDGTPPFTVVGTGWTSVLVARLPEAGPDAGPDAADTGRGNPLGAFLATVPPVSGDWGSGRLLKSRLFTVLVTDDGRVLAGAVTPERLYAAAAASK